MGKATPHGDMAQCIQDCLDCYRLCTGTAMTHCLRAGGPHVEQEHFGLMLNCADICRAAADFMLSESRFHRRLCAICADVCEACAESCRDIGDMDACAAACERCAASCGAMSTNGRPVQTEPLLTHPRSRLP
jgi:hypothetical protein